MTNLQLLTELEWKLQCSKHSMPPNYIPKTKYTDKTANGLTKAVITWINLHGGFAERISTTGRWIDNSKIVTNVIGQQKKIGSGKYIKGTGTVGSADISTTLNGRSWKIEIKIGNDRQSEAQKEYEERTVKSGGVYSIVRTFDDFIEKYYEFLESK